MGLTICLCPIISCSSGPDLEWRQEQGYRWASRKPSGPGFWEKTGFQKLSSSQTNIHFTNRLTDEHIADNRNLLNGSGVAAGDIDGDGLTDLYFAQLEGPNKLYKNVGGLKFEDITENAGVSHRGYYSTGVVFADVDGDADPDLLVTSLDRQNTLYINDGNGRFELNKDSGLGAANGSTTMALADIDGDADLDLYIANYKEKSVKDMYDLMEITWEQTVRREGNTYKLIPPFDEHFTLIPGEEIPDRRELGTEDELYINKGDGSFEKVLNPEERFLSDEGKKTGLARDWGLAAKFQDLNNDGHPDLYVCNDFWTPDRVWINRGDGTFKAIDKLAIRNFSFSSMAVDFSDINRDGSPDFFVTEMLSPVHQRRLRQAVTYSPFIMDAGETKNQPQYMRNTMYLNRADNTFAEMAHYSGVAATGWSWATHFLDVDLDGYEDIIVNTGNAYDVQDLDTQEKLTRKMTRNRKAPRGYIMEYPPLKLNNMVFRNNGDLTFTDKSPEWGFTTKDISHGLAAADLDNDGDLDLAVNRLNMEAIVYENRATAPRIAVRLKGNKPNTQGIGAKIELIGGPVTQNKEVVAGGSYVSGSDPLVVFAAGSQNANHVLKVTWPGGSKSVIDSVKSNRIYEIEEPAVSGRKEIDRPVEGPGPNHSLFEDVSDRLNHSHYEKAFNDFKLQLLLPVRLSRMGPGMAWIDVDRDGDDDLLIGTGKEGRMGVFENLGDGRFKVRELVALTEQASRDQTALIGWKEAEQTRILVGSSNYEEQSAGAASAFNYTISTTRQPRQMSGPAGFPDFHIETDTVPGSFSTTGALAAADYDGDGDPDLFVGGRVVPGHYPMVADSRLFMNEKGDFRLDERNSEILNETGLVTGAVFSDYDGDGDPDLLISREWDSILLLENRSGIFHDISSQVGLDRYKGWWNGIATGDFNNDGRPDIIATNWGLNSRYQIDSGYPLKIYYDDFDGDQRLELIEAYYNSDIASYVPRRGLYELYNAIPTITANVRSHRQFAVSSLGEILGRKPEDIPSKAINTLEHMLFINEGDGYSAHPLPEEAQFTAAFYAGVADFDNDGNEDLFLSQNLFALPPLTPRLDAGRGLWLKGNGQGRLRSLSGTKTGVKIYGEQRGAALGDFNKDGKIDLAVSQNGAETKLYINRVEKPGLRIRLRGPDSNVNGIGSGIRLIYEDGSRGPRREIQAGSGYWSQNSTTQVMGMAARPVKIEIMWFDGTKQLVGITKNKSEYTIAYPGGDT